VHRDLEALTLVADQVACGHSTFSKKSSPSSPPDAELVLGVLRR